MNIIPFDYEGSQIRVVTQNGEPWWVASDVCKVLEHSDVSKAVSRLDEDEKGTTNVRTLGGYQEMLCINEPGLYSLILTSRKPEAKAFKRWITHDVIPSIRKTGAYSAQPLQGVSIGLGDVIEDPKLLTKYIHHLKGLQEVLYPANVQEELTAREKLVQDITRVLKRVNKPLTPVKLQSSYLKNATREDVARTLEDMTNAGTLKKEYTPHAPEGRYYI
jgi:hypothetical protein